MNDTQKHTPTAHEQGVQDRRSIADAYISSLKTSKADLRPIPALWLCRAAAPDLLEALKELASIARMYHTGEQEGHEDACENPGCCGHCLAMRKVNAAIAKATES